MIDCWFLSKILNLLNYERELAKGRLTEELYTQGKKLGYPDSTIARLSGCEVKFQRKPTFKMVDTCAGEFAAHTPYFYATYDTEEAGGEDEALEFIGENREKQTVIVLGSGPIRIGQGIEFDYASVHCVMSLRQLGYEVVIINNNPETVSTDFDTGDRLYFEPLSPRTCWTLSTSRSPSAWWWLLAARRPSSSPRLWRPTTSPFWAPPPTPSTWPRTGNGSTNCWSAPASSGLRATPS